MDLFHYNGFQTVEFVLLLVLVVWILLGRQLHLSFFAGWCLTGLAGMLALKVSGEHFPVLPFYVSLWRMVATVFAAVILNGYLTEWKDSPRGLWPYLFGGSLLTVSGAALSWLDNWVASSAMVLMAAFVGLGYCVRENLLRRPMSDARPTG